MVHNECLSIVSYYNNCSNLECFCPAKVMTLSIHVILSQRKSHFGQIWWMVGSFGHPAFDKVSIFFTILSRSSISRIFRIGNSLFNSQILVFFASLFLAQSSSSCQNCHILYLLENLQVAQNLLQIKNYLSLKGYFTQRNS